MSETQNQQPQANNIQSLRATLFQTLSALGDKDKPMEIERAKAICDVSQTIINSVKAEIDFAKTTGAKVSSEFIPVEEVKPLGLAGPSALKALQQKGLVTEPAPGIRVHKMQG